jgi:hypothetical protein
MHNHGTAVLTGPAEAMPAGITGASARDQWLARCTEDAAKALAHGQRGPAATCSPRTGIQPEAGTLPGLRRYGLHVDGRRVHPLLLRTR